MTTTEQRNAAYDRATASGRCHDDAYANELARLETSRPVLVTVDDVEPRTVCCENCESEITDGAQVVLVMNGDRLTCFCSVRCCEIHEADARAMREWRDDVAAGRREDPFGE